MRVLIVGCGYVGLPLGAELVRRGHQVLGLRRSARANAELEAAGIKPIIADVAKRETLPPVATSFDWVVNLVSSTGGGVEEYRDVYRNGTRNLLEWLQEAPLKKYVYTSSTGVYGQNDGSIVTETSPTEPASETARILVETEKLLFDAAKQNGFPAVVLRVAGIYGPSRGHLFNQFLKDEATITGDGRRIMNMIHREDLIGVILAALEKGKTGAVYNAVDDEPVSEIDFLRWLAETLGKPMPPTVPERDRPARKARGTYKTVSNRRLKDELKYRFKFPNFRAGYALALDQLIDTAGGIGPSPIWRAT